MINADDIFKKIGFILNDLQDQHDYLAHHPEKINIPELQLFLANADFLAEHAKIHIRLREQEASNAAPLPASPPIDEPAVDTLTYPDVAEIEEQESRIDLSVENVVTESSTVEHEEDDTEIAELRPSFEFLLNTSEKVERFDFEDTPVDEMFDRKLTAAEEAVLEAKKEVVTSNSNIDEQDEEGPEPFMVEEEELAQNEEVGTEPFANTENIAERLLQESDKKPTINELLAKNNTHTSVSSKNGGAVTDLKQAINLNDKLLFIKDLFNGYNLAYAEAIDILNKQPDFDAADNFLQKNYAEKNNWKDKQATVDRFYQLLNRRFLG